MRIAHIDGFAGVAWRLAEAQRALGHEATVFCLRETPYQFRYDIRIPGAEGPLDWNLVMLSKWRTFAEFDVVHVHGGIWRTQFFYPLFKRRFRWKTLAVHMHGSETRTGKGLHHLDSADLVFYSTPDLAHWLPQGIWIPNPVELPELAPEPKNDRVRFGHFVSSAVNKGTDRVIGLFKETFGPVESSRSGQIEKFTAKEADLWVVTQLPHDQALRIMASCDAVIDQIAAFGIYGMVSIEGMAMGKPVLGTPRLEWYPGCPILPLGDARAGERLREVASDTALRGKLGAAGRAYVAEVHDASRVARRVLKEYYRSQQVPALTAPQATSYWRRRGRSYAREFASANAQARYGAQTQELMEILSSLSFETVVEVGCGFGRVGAQVIGRFGGSWTGVDLSRAQLEEARRQHPSLGGAVVEATSTHLPIRSRACDLAVSVEMLLHIPPDRILEALKELLRITRRYVVHLDWYEDYLVGHQTGWCWVHDYPALWRSIGAEVREVRLKSTGIQSVFLISRPSGETRD